MKDTQRPPAAGSAARGRSSRRGRRPKGWLFARVVEVLVVVVLVAAGVLYFVDPHWTADPRTQPAAVAPPKGLEVPRAAPVHRVAGPARAGQTDASALAERIRPMLRHRALGKHFALLVTDLASGKELFRDGARTVTPASTTKLLTTTAALDVLGPMARFRTTARWMPRRHLLVLVGGGDPFLASTPKRGAIAYPDRADVTTLAKAAVAKLRAQGVKRAHIAYDDSYFSGPGVNPHWPSTYLPESVVPPISSLWVDEGHNDSGYAFVGDPAARAGDVFRGAVKDAGLKVTGPTRHVSAPAGATEVAKVQSAPLGEIVERTLAVSDNEAAEVLARHVGLAERQEGSFKAGTAAVLDVVRRLGVDVRGDRLYDGSGLSRDDRLEPETLAGVLRVAASPDHPELRSVITGLPVAGFTGSLQYRFDRGPDAGRGRVRAKTGTLTGVHGLAGVADDIGGGRMGFVIVADRLPYTKELKVRVLIDRIAAVLGACRCGVGSGP